MLKRKLWLAAAVCLVGLSNAALAADDRAAIEALYTRVARAMSAKDARAMVSAGTRDFTYTEAGTTMTGDQIARRMESRFQMMQGSPKCRFTVLSCQIKGKTATVTTSDYTEAQTSGQSGRPHRIVATGKSRDLLVKTDKGWLMKSVIITSSSLSMDGKPMGAAGSGIR